jgi:hypothetical protein
MSRQGCSAGCSHPHSHWSSRSSSHSATPTSSHPPFTPLNTPSHPPFATPPLLHPSSLHGPSAAAPSAFVTPVAAEVVAQELSLLEDLAGKIAARIQWATQRGWGDEVDCASPVGGDGAARAWSVGFSALAGGAHPSERATDGGDCASSGGGDGAARRMSDGASASAGVALLSAHGGVCTSADLATHPPLPDVLSQPVLIDRRQLPHASAGTMAWPHPAGIPAALAPAAASDTSMMPPSWGRPAGAPRGAPTARRRAMPLSKGKTTAGQGPGRDGVLVDGGPPSPAPGAEPMLLLAI